MIKIDYYMSKLYVFPSPNIPIGTLISEINWGDIFHFKINKNYLLAWIYLKPMGNNTLELGIKLLDISGNKFIETPHLLIFPEFYNFPQWLNLNSPQLINRIRKSIVDVNLDSLPANLDVVYTRDFVTFKTNGESSIGNFSWDNFIVANLINHNFSNIIKLTPVAYRKIKITAYNSLIPDSIYHVGTIIFPEEYIFPYWFEHVNGCFYKLITKQFKSLNVDVLSTIFSDEILVHMHLNMFHIYVKPEYITCAAIKSISLYNYKYNSISSFDGIDQIFLYKKINSIEITLALSEHNGKFIKLHSKLPYNGDIKPDWATELSKHATSSDELIALDIDLSSDHPLKEIKMTKNMNKYILEPKLEGHIVFIALSTSDTFYQIVKPPAQIKKIIITPLLCYRWKIKIEVNDPNSKTYTERWRFFQGENLVKFLTYANPKNS